MAVISPVPKLQFFDSNGDPLAAGKLYTYEPGTTTAKATYLDAERSAANTNPIVLDARGECVCYLNGSTKMVLKTAADATIWTRDAVDSGETGTDVSTFGATGDGVTDDLAAFQAAINATTDGEIQVFHIPSGDYEGALASLNIGTRTVVWDEEGDVSYVTSAPPGNRIATAFLGDKTRPWHYGHNALADNTTAGDATDYPVIRAARYSRHTGGTSSFNQSCISAYVDVNGPSSSPTGRVDNYENAYVGQVDCYRNSTTTGSPNISVFQGTCFKHNASTGGFFGANFVARDQTKLGAANSFGGLVGCEVDVVCSGPDSGESRIGLDVIARGYDASADGATTVHAGLRVRPANTGVLSSEPVTLTNGIIVEPGTLGALTNGITVDGAMGTAHIEISSDDASVGVLRVGSKRNTAVQTSRIDMIGWNASNVKTAYGQIITNIVTATAGAEDGSMVINTRRAGTSTTEIGFNGWVILGSPTGSYKGVGTINCAGDIYKNNTAYTNPDYVLEHAYRGAIEQFAGNPGAAEYSGLMTLDALREYTREHLRLPGISDEPMGAFERSDKVLEKLEELALYVLELHDRLAKLEGAS